MVCCSKLQISFFHFLFSWFLLIVVKHCDWVLLYLSMKYLSVVISIVQLSGMSTDDELKDYDLFTYCYPILIVQTKVIRVMVWKIHTFVLLFWLVMKEIFWLWREGEWRGKRIHATNKRKLFSLPPYPIISFVILFDIPWMPLIWEW